MGIVALLMPFWIRRREARKRKTPLPGFNVSLGLAALSNLANARLVLLVGANFAGRRNIFGTCAFKNFLRSLGLVGTIRVNGKQNSAIFDATLIPLGFILRNSHADQGSSKTPDRAANSGTGQSRH